MKLFVSFPHEAKTLTESLIKGSLGIKGLIQYKKYHTKNVVKSL